MKIQIILEQQELTTFATRMNILNAQQEQLNKLTQEVHLSKNELDTTWKSIYRRWQLEKPEERASLNFTDNLEIKLENGAIFCELPDKKEG
jgi:prefoldin subunit 5